MSETVSVPPCYSLLGFNCSSDSSLTLREGTSDVTQCHDQERRRTALCQGEATRARYTSCARCLQRSRLGGASQMFNSCTAALEPHSQGTNQLPELRHVQRTSSKSWDRPRGFI